MLITGLVADPSQTLTPDGGSQPFNQGRANEMIVSELHGKYLTQTYRGNVFYGSTSTAGVTITIASTTVPTYTIWNPSGSGRLCVPIVTLVGWNATTPAALGELVWTATTGAGDRPATTAPITGFTGGATPISATLGGGKVSRMLFGNQATTISITAAASFYRATGMTIMASTAAGTSPGFLWRDDWDGTSIIPPGNAIHLMGSTAVLINVVVTTAWAEIPL